MPSLLEEGAQEEETMPALFSNENLLEFKRKLTRAEESLRYLDKN